MLIRNEQSPLRLTSSILIECGSNRISSRSVSWNSSGSYLAMASSDRMARLWTIEASGSAREVLVVSGHAGPVTKVRFHPSEPNHLCTAAADQTVRLWDIRQATQRPTGRIDLQKGSGPVAVEWNRTSSLLAVAEREGSILIYDTRKLGGAFSHASGSAAGSSASPLLSIEVAPNTTESYHFSPCGNFLIAGWTRQGEGIGELRILSLKTANNHTLFSSSYPAHSGPIYAMHVSLDSLRLATGGADAMVGIWNLDTMCCTHSITRRVKFIRSVGFSHDSRILATSSEEDGIDLADARDGSEVGSVNLGTRPRAGGAEEIAWHPKSHILACARTDAGPIGPPLSPIIVVKISVNV
jgi:THO complex subunit 3